MRPIKILLADDHEVILDGLQAMLQGENHIEVVGLAHDGDEVLQRLEFDHHPDIIILDINMPVKDGIEITSLVKKKYPGIKILILSMYDQPEFIKKLLQAGADGYILKNSGKEELLKAIDIISRGGSHFSQEVLKVSIDHHFRPEGGEADDLSDREKEVIQFIAQGLSSKEIAIALNISTHTVDSHRKHILAKINAKNSVDITRYALRTGIIKGFDMH